MSSSEGQFCSDRSESDKGASTYFIHGHNVACFTEKKSICNAGNFGQRASVHETFINMWHLHMCGIIKPSESDKRGTDETTVRCIALAFLKHPEKRHEKRFEHGNLSHFDNDGMKHFAIE